MLTFFAKSHTSHAKCLVSALRQWLKALHRCLPATEGVPGFCFDFAWEGCIFAKKVTILLGSGDHDLHHSQLKCLLFFQKVTPPMQNAWFQPCASGLSPSTGACLPLTGVPGFCFDFAWEGCIFAKKMTILLGSGDHDLHHSQLKCSLFFQKVTPPMQNARFFLKLGPGTACLPALRNHHARFLIFIINVCLFCILCVPPLFLLAGWLGCWLAGWLAGFSLILHGRAAFLQKKCKFCLGVVTMTFTTLS